MSYLRELNVFIEEDGHRKPFFLLISNPEKVVDADDYACSIHAPLLFKRDKIIYGADAQQAAELAIKFANDLLADKQLVNGNGNPVKII